MPDELNDAAESTNSAPEKARKLSIVRVGEAFCLKVDTQSDEQFVVEISRDQAFDLLIDLSASSP